MIKNAAATYCVNSCPSSQYLNFAGKQCVYSCSEGEYINLDGLQFVNDCDLVNAGRTHCFSLCGLGEDLSDDGTYRLVLTMSI